MLPLTDLRAQCGGPVVIRLADEDFAFDGYRELLAFVRRVCGEVRPAREAVWMARARAGWVLCQLSGVGPFRSQKVLAETFGLHVSRLRSWMRLARAVVHQGSGRVEIDKVRAAVAELDRRRSERAMTARQRKLFEAEAGKPAEQRSMRSVEEAVGLRGSGAPNTGETSAHRGARGGEAGDPNRGETFAHHGARFQSWGEAWSWGEQLGLDELYRAVGGVRHGLARASDAALAGWIREGRLRIDAGLAAELLADGPAADGGDRTDDGRTGTRARTTHAGRG